MKGRSHRLPTSAPPDDWVDESWTVDCVCGVNFDDGEEMVNCDECGVWVHTRCSRYVKGEASFACDKCKSKNSRNDNEETEVAQLLVELPTKTMRMEKSSPLNQPARRPFRLWSEMPMEEKVHVQGIPGGDPALFDGLSSVFSRELWNCTGYVPKKFNFQYKEFPCWEEKQEADHQLEEENDNPVNKGADVLFSLSKDTVLRMSGMRDQAVESGCDGKSSLKQRKKAESKDLHNRHHLQNGETKERRLLKPIIIHSSKRKKEDLGTCIDQNGKKKAKAVDKEYDSKKKGAQKMTIKTVFTPTNDAKQLEFYEARAPKFHKTETQNIKCDNSKDMAQELVCDGISTADHNVVNPGDSLASKEYPPEGFSPDPSGHNIVTGIGVKEYKAGDQVHSSTESSLRIKDGIPLPSEKNDVGRSLVNEEGVSMGIRNSNSNGRHSPSVLTDLQKSEQSDEGLTHATSDFKGNHALHNSNGDMSMSFAQPITKVKVENDFGNTGEILPYNSSTSNDLMVEFDGINKITQDRGISGDHMSENIEMVNVVASSRQSHDLEVHDVDRCPAAVSDQHIGKADELSGSPCQLKQELQSTESSIPVQKEPSVAKYGSKLTEEPLKSSGTILSPSITSSQRKVLSNFGKSCSPSSTVMISKSPISDSLKHADSHNLNCVTKHSAMNNCAISMKKEHTANDAIKDEDRHEILRRAVKERPKSFVDPTSKALNHNKISHTSVSKQTMADSKDFIVSPKTSAVNVNLAVGQPIDSLQTQHELTVENKVLASGLPHRGEKFSQPSCLVSSKLNHALAALPPAPSKGHAGLSDEELALLLHQELNSSPRVPRVPRMRQTGSLPQSASSAATCMQFKRSSSLAGKDNIMVSRRRTKDVCRDGARSSRDHDDAKKLDRKSSSPDQQKPDLICTIDASSNRNMYDDSSNLVHSVTKNIPTSSTMAISGGVSSPRNQSLSYIRNSPRNISDDDTGSTDVFSHQTLPGLLSEIMSKGKRMTYEELCNEVLPHWPNLRKHNGERYAYSSHSQAVLDCLRNRTEWAQLVDRGPKTNTNKKRRSKVDAELEDECGKSVQAEGEGKSLESREFPKGKRKARKRRRLILQGREIKDVRKTRKSCLLTDDDYALSSNSSEESMFSEDETQDGGTCRAESEASSSSDEPGATS